MERGRLERHDDVDVGGRGAEATATVRDAECGRAGQRQGKARQDRGAEQSRAGQGRGEQEVSLATAMRWLSKALPSVHTCVNYLLAGRKVPEW